jgi:hypothetical protein
MLSFSCSSMSDCRSLSSSLPPPDLLAAFDMAGGLVDADGTGGGGLAVLQQKRLKQQAAETLTSTMVVAADQAVFWGTQVSGCVCVWSLCVCGRCWLVHIGSMRASRWRSRGRV